MGRTRTPRWARRFRQRRAATRIPSGYEPGHAHGFTGEAADIPVSRTYHRSETWDQPEPRVHLAATIGYLYAIVKRSYEQASERGDRAVIDLLDDVHTDLADRILVELDDIRTTVQARGYMGIDVAPDGEGAHEVPPSEAAA